MPRPRPSAPFTGVGTAGLLCSVLAWSLLSGCSESDGAAPPARATGPDLADGVAGKVEFEKRPILGFGILAGKDAVERRPARFVRVEVRRADDSLIASAVTDDEGRYGVEGPFPDGFRVLAFAESPRGVESSVPVRVLDRDGNEYAAASAPQGAIREGEKSIVDVVASVDTPLRVAGAFNIVDAIITSGLFWVEETGIQPVLATVRWESGGFEQPGTFFQRGTNEISILGGVGDLVDSTDTDEFDDVVIAHEYWHFLQANHAFSSSPGGPHSGEDLVPLLAFEEAFADWFGAYSQGTSLYQDTFGNEDGTATCSVCDDLEKSLFQSVKGIGSEQAIYEVLWDLADGRDGQPDTIDTERIAVDVGEMLEAVLAFDPKRDVYTIGSFLEILVDTSALTALEVQSLAAEPIDQDITFPAIDRDVPSSGKDIFPIPLLRGSIVSGSVDAVSAPSTTRRNVERGFDSIRYYSIELERTSRVTLTLRIDGTGEPPTDLDLRLLTPDQRVLGVSDSSTPVETISRELSSGRYLVAVFGFFVDNRGTAIPNSAAYTLEFD